MTNNYEFNIYGTIDIPDESLKMAFNNENIRTFVRLYDYVNYYMPLIYVKFEIDRKVANKMVKKGRTVLVHLEIEKFIKNDNETATGSGSIILKGDFDIETKVDVQYTEKLDYAEGHSKDKYKQVDAVLVPKETIDANKMIESVVYQDVAPQDLVLYYLSKTHALIEPFDYNNKIEQLVIPAMDSLIALINYINNIQQFYKTKTMFFIDEPYCTYLLSRSAGGLEKEGDDYNTINFNITNIKEDSGYFPGLQNNDDDKSISIQVSSLDTEYRFNQVTARIANEPIVITNPDPKNTKDKGNVISNMIQHVGEIQSSFINSVINRSTVLQNKVGEIGGFFSKIRGSVNDGLSRINEMQSKLMDKGLEIFSKVPSAIPVEITDEFTFTFDIPVSPIKNMIKNQLMNKLSPMNKLNKLAGSFLDKLGGNGITNTLYKMEYIHNKINCLSAINAQANSNNIVSGLGNIVNLAGSVGLPFKSGMANITNAVSKVTNITDKVVGTADKIVGTIEKIQKITYYSKLIEQFKEHDTSMNLTIGNMKKLNKAVTMLKKVNNTLSSATKGINNCVNVIKSVSNGLNKYSSLLSSISNIDLKGMFISNNIPTTSFIDINSFSDISGITSGLPNKVNDVASKLIGDGPIGNVINKASNVIGGIENILSKGSISTEDIEKIAKATNINDAGKAGLINFATNMNIGGQTREKTGNVIVKVRNGNFNAVIAKKAEVETMNNRIIINKFGIDGAIFTPNKVYNITNEDTHKDKDGQFKLNKKSEIYVRTGTAFICNVRLDMGKVPNLTETVTENITDLNKDAGTQV